MISFLLYLAAAICFILAAVGFSPSPRINLVALGLFFWVLVAVLATVPK